MRTRSPSTRAALSGVSLACRVMPQDSPDTAVTVVFDAVSLLEGVRVLDLGIWRPAPVRGPAAGRPGRRRRQGRATRWRPHARLPRAVRPRSCATSAASSSTCTTTHDRTRAVDIAAEVDIAVEGFRPGVADRLGVGYEALRAVNPAIVYCSISGYGQDGPRAMAPGHDVNYQAYAGVLAPRAAMSRAPPRVPYADLAAGLAAAMAMCAAYVRRLRTGEGEYIDVSMTDVLAHWNGECERDGTGAGGRRRRDHRQRPATACTPPPTGAGCRSASPPRTASGRACAGDRPEEHAALPFGERVRRHAELDAAVAGAPLAPDADEAVDRLDRPACPSRPCSRAPGDGRRPRRAALVHPARYRHHPVL